MIVTKVMFPGYKQQKPTLENLGGKECVGGLLKNSPKSAGSKLGKDVKESWIPRETRAAKYRVGSGRKGNDLLRFFHCSFCRFVPWSVNISAFMPRIITNSLYIFTSLCQGIKVQGEMVNIMAHNPQYISMPPLPGLCVASLCFSWLQVEAHLLFWDFCHLSPIKKVLDTKSQQMFYIKVWSDSKILY